MQAYELHRKFEQEASSFVLDYKGLQSFYAGLEGLVGPPQPYLLEGMRREHCKSEDSDIEFTTSNYGTKTSSKIEWWCANAAAWIASPLWQRVMSPPSASRDARRARVPYAGS